MTPKEALDLTFKIYDTKYGDKQLTILNLGLSFEETEECKTVLVEAIAELEELKRDVKRYFHDNDLEGDEYNMLWSKLMKAGNGK